MQGIDLGTPQGILEFYNLSNRGGRWISEQIALMDRYRANTLLECEVGSNFGGPHLEIDRGKNGLVGNWQIPVTIKDCTFSWHFLVNGVFDYCKIPCNTYDGTTPREKSYPKDYEYFKRTLMRETQDGAGRRFTNKVNEKYTAFAETFFNNQIGINYSTSRPGSIKDGVIRRGDKITVAAFFERPFWTTGAAENPGEIFADNFQDYNGVLVAPASCVKGIIRKDF